MKEPTLKDVLDELKQLRAEIKASNKAMLTVPEAAEFLGISAKTLRNQLGPRAPSPFPVKPRRSGRKVLFRRIDLEQFVSGVGE